MILRYPKVNAPILIASYEDYRKIHHDFIRTYKKLYDDVSAFSLLPEKFVREVEPVIEGYLKQFSGVAGKDEKTGLLKVLTDFISRFYEFMEEATEMFTRHQALANQSLEYMEKVSSLNRNLWQVPAATDQEAEFVDLIPELNTLTEELAWVEEKVERTREDLTELIPFWEQIRQQMEVHAAACR